MRSDEMPLGFAMALAMNTSAMENFSKLDENRKHEIIEGTKNIKSRDEMRNYVNSIGETGK